MNTFTRIEDTGLIGVEQSKRMDKNRRHALWGAVVFASVLSIGCAWFLTFALPTNAELEGDIDRAIIVSHIIGYKFAVSTFTSIFLMLFMYFVAFTLGQLPHQRNERRAIEYAMMKDALEVAKNNNCASDAFKTKAEVEATKYFIELAKDWRLTPEQLGLDTKASGSDTITIDPNIIFDPTHPRYSPELAGALATWLSFEFNPLPSGVTPKTEITARLRDWAQDHNAPFSTKAEERIAIVTNWDKNGNKY